MIRDIHRDYLDAGARLQIVNSFALARHVLEPIGLGADFEALKRRAVALCEQAARRWLRTGVQIVGCCCGIVSAHIRRLGGKLAHS
jgi:methionine synthase I (cobalamin-dependent)